MEFTAAVIKEQGITFAVVMVKPNLATVANRDATQQGLMPLFPGTPIVLCWQDSRGAPSFYGRKDLVRFLRDISMDRMPWKKYSSQMA